jgi:hypothetical protein
MILRRGDGIAQNVVPWACYTKYPNYCDRDARLRESWRMLFLWDVHGTLEKTWVFLCEEISNLTHRPFSGAIRPGQKNPQEF